jgi:hypothetical protein
LTDDEISAAMLMPSEYDRLMALRQLALSKSGDRSDSPSIEPADWAAIECVSDELLVRGNPIQ